MNKLCWKIWMPVGGKYECRLVKMRDSKPDPMQVGDDRNKACRQAGVGDIGEQPIRNQGILNIDAHRTVIKLSSHYNYEPK